MIESTLKDFSTDSSTNVDYSRIKFCGILISRKLEKFGRCRKLGFRNLDNNLSDSSPVFVKSKKGTK